MKIKKGQTTIPKGSRAEISTARSAIIPQGM